MSIRADILTKMVDLAREVCVFKLIMTLVSLRRSENQLCVADVRRSRYKRKTMIFGYMTENCRLTENNIVCMTRGKRVVCF